MFLAQILSGAVLLTLGRKLFWVFVAATGFAAGLAIATRVLEVKPEWMALVIALVAGLIGALAAILIQRMAITIAGFLIGALIGISLAGALGVERGLWWWAAIIAGGILGVVLMAAAFDWALIALSSLAGASLLTEGLHVSPALAWPVLLVLLVVGVLVQVGLMRSEKHTEEKKRPA
jgi:hypothetical protein